MEDFTLKYLGRERRQAQRKDGFLEFLTPESLREKRLPERFRCVTFDRASAIRNAQAEFFALGHPFVDAMIQQIGDYDFGGHTAVRFIKVLGLGAEEAQAGYQFNFVVRGRVQREDGDEYIFGFHTVVISADGLPNARMASSAAMLYSSDESQLTGAERLLAKLDSLSIEDAYQTARAEIERTAQFWDWDEDVELVGLAKIVPMAF